MESAPIEDVHGLPTASSGDMRGRSTPRMRPGRSDPVVSTCLDGLLSLAEAPLLVVVSATAYQGSRVWSNDGPASARRSGPVHTLAWIVVAASTLPRPIESAAGVAVDRLGGLLILA